METEYVFGPGTLRTKGAAHTDLTGKQTITLEYENQRVIHDFRVVRKTKSDMDVAGNCYDWYEIAEHYTVIQNDIKAVEELTADLEQAYELLYGGDAV